MTTSGKNLLSLVFIRHGSGIGQERFGIKDNYDAYIAACDCLRREFMLSHSLEDWLLWYDIFNECISAYRKQKDPLSAWHQLHILDLEITSLIAKAHGNRKESNNIPQILDSDDIDSESFTLQADAISCKTTAKDVIAKLITLLRTQNQ